MVSPIVLNGATIRDDADNDAVLTFSPPNTSGVLVNTTAPGVVSINRANANPSNAGSVDFDVTFSASVSGVDATDFALTTSGVSGASITGVSGSGAAYTVSVNTGTGN